MGPRPWPAARTSGTFGTWSPNLGGVTTLSFGETNRLGPPVVDTLKRRFAYLDGWPTGA
jgi:hypothetical protein